MSFAEIIKLIAENGTSVILMAYFLLKDWKFNENILKVLGETKEVLAKLEMWHEKEGDKE